MFERNQLLKVTMQAKLGLSSMSWRDAPSDDTVFCQTPRDDGKPLGVIARYYGATYAWVSLGGMKRERSGTRYFNARRLGACSDRPGGARRG
jgi:hypothetical protein